MFIPIDTLNFRRKIKCFFFFVFIIIPAQSVSTTRRWKQFKLEIRINKAWSRIEKGEQRNYDENLIQYICRIYIRISFISFHRFFLPFFEINFSIGPVQRRVKTGAWSIQLKKDNLHLFCYSSLCRTWYSEVTSSVPSELKIDIYFCCIAFKRKAQRNPGQGRKPNLTERNIWGSRYTEPEKL